MSDSSKSSATLELISCQVCCPLSMESVHEHELYRLFPPSFLLLSFPSSLASFFYLSPPSFPSLFFASISPSSPSLLIVYIPLSLIIVFLYPSLPPLLSLSFSSPIPPSLLFYPSLPSLLSLSPSSPISPSLLSYLSLPSLLSLSPSYPSPIPLLSLFPLLLSLLSSLLSCISLLCYLSLPPSPIPPSFSYPSLFFSPSAPRLIQFGSTLGSLSTPVTKGPPSHRDRTSYLCKEREVSRVIVRRATVGAVMRTHQAHIHQPMEDLSSTHRKISPIIIIHPKIHSSLHHVMFIEIKISHYDQMYSL